MSTTPRRLVVTGASGFIAGNLCRRAAAMGWRVHAISRQPVFLGAEITHVAATDYADVTVNPGDVLVHLAGPRDAVGPSVDVASETDAEATRVGAVFAGCHGRLIYVSSAAVYDDGQGCDATPEAPTRDTRYARIKLAGEAAAVAAGATVVRVSNVYGDGMAPHCVTAEILAKLRTPPTEPFEVHAKTPVRDFVSVADVADALISIAKGHEVGTFNVGTGVGTSVEDLAAIALTEAGLPPRALQATNETERPSRIVVDIEATKRAFGWTPQVSLRAGIKALIDGGHRWAA